MILCPKNGALPLPSACSPYALSELSETEGVLHLVRCLSNIKHDETFYQMVRMDATVAIIL